MRLAPKTVLSFAAIAGVAWSCRSSEEKPVAPSDRKPFVVKLQNGSEYQPLLQGPPKTIGFHLGRVVLEPGKSVGIHNTEI